VLLILTAAALIIVTAVRADEILRGDRHHHAMSLPSIAPRDRAAPFTGGWPAFDRGSGAYQVLSVTLIDGVR
jgi:hypothetical protein